MLAIANNVDGETSSSLRIIDARRLAAVSFRPSATSQNRSVLAVHSTITYVSVCVCVCVCVSARVCMCVCVCEHMQVAFMVIHGYNY